MPVKKEVSEVFLQVNVFSYNKYDVNTGKFSSLYFINGFTEIIIVDTIDNTVVYNGKQEGYRNYYFSVKKNHTYKIKVLSSKVSHIDEIWYEIKADRALQGVSIILQPYPIYYVKTSIAEQDRDINFTIYNNKNPYASYFNSISAVRDICKYEYYENNNILYSVSEVDSITAHNMMGRQCYIENIGAVYGSTNWYDINSIVINNDLKTNGFKQFSCDFVIKYRKNIEYECTLKIYPSVQEYYVPRNNWILRMNYAGGSRLLFYTEDSLVEKSSGTYQAFKAEYKIVNHDKGETITGNGYVVDELNSNLLPLGFAPMDITDYTGRWYNPIYYWQHYEEYHSSEINIYNSYRFIYYRNDNINIDVAGSDEQYNTIYNKLMDDSSVTIITIDNIKHPSPDALANSEWYANVKNSNDYLTTSSVVLDDKVIRLNKNITFATDNEGNCYNFSSPMWTSYSDEYEEF